MVQVMVQVMVQMCRVGNIVWRPTNGMFDVGVWCRVHVQVLKMVVVNQMVIQVVVQMVMFEMMIVWVMDDFVVDNLMRMEKKSSININTFKRKRKLIVDTFGLDNLKTTTAAETTNDNRPSVSAFHAFNAINAKANGNKTVVLNFKPSKNGISTFLTRPRPNLAKRNELDKRFLETMSWLSGLTLIHIGFL